MTEVILARHGETVWHTENRYAGRTDVDLTARGLDQAEDLGRWAAAHRVSTVVSSDLSRAVLTAAPAARAVGTELLIDPRLREVDFGYAEGLTRAEMTASIPEALAAFHAAPASSPLPGAESGAAAVERAWPAIEEVAARADGPVLVVMHSTVMRLILCRALGLPLDTYRRTFPSVQNVATTVLSVQAGARPALLAYNVPTVRR